MAPCGGLGGSAYYCQPQGGEIPSVPVKVGRGRMLPSSGSHRGHGVGRSQKLSNSEWQRGLEVGQNRGLPSSWGGIGRRLPSSGTTRVVGSAEAGMYSESCRWRFSRAPRWAWISARPLSCRSRIFLDWVNSVIEIEFVWASCGPPTLSRNHVEFSKISGRFHVHEQAAHACREYPCLLASSS